MKLIKWILSGFTKGQKRIINKINIELSIKMWRNYMFLIDFKEKNISVSAVIIFRLHIRLFVINLWVWFQLQSLFTVKTKTKNNIWQQQHAFLPSLFFVLVCMLEYNNTKRKLSTQFRHLFLQLFQNWQTDMNIFLFFLKTCTSPDMFWHLQTKFSEK